MATSSSFPLPNQHYPLPRPSLKHVICAAPKLVEKHLKAAGGPGLVVDPTKIVWTPYNPERDYANFGR